MSVKIPPRLKAHIQAKLANSYWLDGCMNGRLERFPYRPVSRGKAQLKPKAIYPDEAPHDPFVPLTNRKPLFLVNIPVGVSPRLEHHSGKVTHIFKQLEEESFGTTPNASSRLVGNRVAVVLGVNQIYSIDPVLNRSFIKWIRLLPQVIPIHGRVFGFFWQPEWGKFFSEPKLKGKVLAKKWEKLRWDCLNNKTLYPLQKCFLLLKAVSPASAKKVQKAYEQPDGLHPNIVSQIPYQDLRERIKTSRLTRDLLDAMETGAPHSMIYYVTMDADTLALRVRAGGMGAFSRLDKLIVDHHAPSIASLGYQLASTEPPLLRLAVEIDMAVRSQMPWPYIPEPCGAYKVRLPDEESFLHQLTFKGAGKGLESRRFIQSGSRYFTDGVVLGGDGIVTTTPERMKTKNNQRDTLTLSNLKTKCYLRSLRGRTIQTHAFPKQWAEMMYSGMGLHTACVTNATTPMMHIFGVFDPISRMYAAADRYTSSTFDKVLREHGRALTAVESEIVAEARKALLKLKIKKNQIDVVVETARKSGKAISGVLKKAVERLS